VTPRSSGYSSRRARGCRRFQPPLEPGPPDEHDVDLDRALIRVLGKGGRERTIYVGAKAAKALDRYIFDHRARHRSPPLDASEADLEPGM
jgi:hypothetical protein